ncbi:MAG: ABC transporter ATP-binding protein [Sediminibacterium sp.]
MAIIQTSNLTYTFSKGPSLIFPSIQAEENSELLILGNSGTGKTTLLHLLAGLRKPTSGEVEVNGVKLSSLGGASLDRFRGKNIGVVFQTSHFVQSLSVLDNILLAPYFSNNKVSKTDAEKMLDRLNILSKKNKKTSTLSVGEQQRVAIARALLNNPSLILADEPTSALDDENAKEVLNLLREQTHALKAALLIVTHDNRLKDEVKQRIELTASNR